MGNRLSKIYTRTGDEGTTGLGDGSRIAKHHPRMQAMGTVDELNCAIGILLASCTHQPTLTTLAPVQHRLFDLGGEISIPDSVFIEQQDVDVLEQQLDQHNADLPALKNFILPGGSHDAALCHQARALCRRTERTLWLLADNDTVNPASLKFLNRLSDLLFVLARQISRHDGHGEVLWQPRGAAPA